MHQVWEKEGRLIGYPGSIGRFHYGELGDKGFLDWSVSANGAVGNFVITPSRKMIELDFDGLPDIQKIEDVVPEAAGAYVRIRWQVDQEHKQAVDKAQIEALFAHAKEIKIDVRVLPIVRSRAEGLNRAPTMVEKLGIWCSLTDVVAEPLVARLSSLQNQSAEDVAAEVLQRLKMPA
jgi:exonuclease SbcD